MPIASPRALGLAACEAARSWELPLRGALGLSVGTPWQNAGEHSGDVPGFQQMT